MAPSESVDPDDVTRILDGVFRLERAVTRIGNLRLAPWNITLSSYAALRIIESQPELSLVQLARRSFVRPQTMTRMAASLVERGLVSRAERPGNKRALSLSITDAGRVALREMDARVLQIESAFTEALSTDERQELIRMLRSSALKVEHDLQLLESESD